MLTPEQRRWRAEINRGDAQWQAGYRAGLAERRYRAKLSRAHRLALALSDHWRFLLALSTIAAFAVAVKLWVPVAVGAVGVVYAFAAVAWIRELKGRFR